MVGIHSPCLSYILHCTVSFRVFQSSPYFFPSTTLVIFNAYFALALNMLICSSQFNLLSIVIPKNWVLSLEGIILFLRMISIGSSFLFLFFLNAMLTVLLEKIRPISATHASNLLVTPCNAQGVTLQVEPLFW